MLPLRAHSRLLAGPIEPSLFWYASSKFAAASLWPLPSLLAWAPELHQCTPHSQHDEDDGFTQASKHPQIITHMHDNSERTYHACYGTVYMSIANSPWMAG